MLEDHLIWRSPWLAVTSKEPGLSSLTVCALGDVGSQAIVNPRVRAGLLGVSQASLGWRTQLSGVQTVLGTDLAVGNGN